MDEKKEQAKVRERILRVFKARAQSPGGGPAIIVDNESRRQPRRKFAESHIKCAEFPKYELQHSDDDFLLSDTVASPTNETMEKRTSRRKKQSKEESLAGLHSKQDSHAKKNSHGSPSGLHSKHDSHVKKHGHHGHSSSNKTSHCREKRRRSRNERDKERAQKQQQVNPHEREEFRKHVKKAREISKQSSRHNDSLHSDDPLFVAITQNRLTRQAGIYNQGKKSSRLYRDPLCVSERVSAAVEEDVKMIVDPSGSPNLHTSMESLPPPSVVHSTPIQSDRRTRSSSRSGRSLQRRRESESESAKRVHSKSADCQSSGQGSTQVLDMQDLSLQLTKSLDLKHLFPGKDYVGEIKCELQKIMKSHSSGKDEIVSLESVRQLMESSHNTDPKSSKTPAFPKKTPRSHAKAPAVSQGTRPLGGTPLQHATACIQVRSTNNTTGVLAATATDGESPHHSQDQVMLLDVPQASAACNPITRTIDQSHPDTSSRASFTDNALDFLHFAETMAAEAAQQQRSRQRETVSNSSGMQPQSYNSGMEPQSYNSGMEPMEPQSYNSGIEPQSYRQRKSRNEMCTAEYHTSSSSSRGIEDIYRTSHRSRFDHFRAGNLSSFGNERCKVEWQPDVYLDTAPMCMSLRQRYRIDDDFCAKHTDLYEPSSTDLLDHIDVENMEVTGPSPSLPDLYYERNRGNYKESSHLRLNQRHRTIPMHHPATISQFEKCESDSESSPVWRPTFCVSPIRKPQLEESPGAPELYPQKMF